MTYNRKILKSIQYVATSSVLIILIEIIAFYIFSRVIPAEQIGVYAFTVALIEFMHYFVDSKGSKYYIASSTKKNRKELFNSVFSMELIVALLILIFSPILLITGVANHAGVFIILLSTVILKPFWNISTADLQSKFDFKVIEIGRAVGTVMFALVSFLLIYLDFKIYALPVGYLVRNLVPFLFVVPRYNFSLYFDKQLLKEVVKFSFPLFLSTYFAYYYWNIDDIMVGKVLGNEAVGNYWFAFYYPHAILRLQSPFLSLLLPFFTQTTSQDTAKYYSLLTRWSAYIMQIPLVVTLFFGSEIIQLLWGDKWNNAILAFQIYMVLVTIRGTFNYWTDIFTANNQTRFQLKVSILNAVLITIFGFLALKVFDAGIAGMSGAVLLTIIITDIIMGRFLKRIIDISFIKILGAPLFILVVSIVSMYYLSKVFDQMWVTLALYTFGWGIVVGIIERRNLIQFLNKLKAEYVYRPQ